MGSNKEEWEAEVRDLKEQIARLDAANVGKMQDIDDLRKARDAAEHRHNEAVGRIAALKLKRDRLGTELLLFRATICNGCGGTVGLVTCGKCSSEWFRRAEGLQAEVERLTKWSDEAMDVIDNTLSPDKPQSLYAAWEREKRRFESAEAESKLLRADFEALQKKADKLEARAKEAERMLAEVCDAAGEYHAAATKKGAEAFPPRLTDAVVGARQHLALLKRGERG